MHLLDLFAIRVLEQPDATALVDAESGARLTYAALDARVNRAATGLANRGLLPRDRAAFFADGSADLVVAHLATLRLGAIAVPINLAYTAREIGHILEDAEPRLVVVDGERREMIERVPPERRRSVEQVVALGEVASGSPAPAIGEASRGTQSLQQRPGQGLQQPSQQNPHQDPPHQNGSSPALLVYTSGTTGKSKGAVITHDNLLATVTGLLAAWAWRPDDVLLLALPLFHVHGLVVGLHTALAAGASVRLHRRFDTDRVLDELTAGGSPSGQSTAGKATANSATADESTAITADRDRVTLFFGVPTLYVRLLEAIRRRRLEPDAFGHLRLLCSGSAPLAPELFEAFREATGHTLLERYGMTETGMNLSNPYAGPRRPGTVGVPLPGVSARIADPGSLDDGAIADVDDGTAGELLVRGSNVFAGYWRDPEKTAAAFVADGAGRKWFRTGDLARRDPETGYVTLLGRSRELILRGGLNVYPREVEEVLEALPGVAEAAVVGRPDLEYGEVPVAFVVPADGAAPEEAALLAGCRERLAAFKVPVAVRFVEVLPRNALGKVQKHRLPS